MRGILRPVLVRPAFGPRSLCLFLVLALAPVSAARALTLADLRSQARGLALDNGVRLQFSTATVDAFLNEGQRIANTESLAIFKSASLELATGTTYYSLPTDFLMMYRVTLRYLELTEATPAFLSNKAGLKWEENKGLATNYFMNFSSRTKVGFYPWPDSVSSTGTVRYEYLAQVTDMVATTDQPFNGVTELVPYHYIPVFYAAFRMTALNGRSDLAALYRMEFREGVARMARIATDRPSYRPGGGPASTSGRLGPQ